MDVAVIFDMDGLLIDSEPLWWRAGVEALRTVGVQLDEALCRETMGMRTDAALAHWYQRHPWQGRTAVELEREVNVRVLQLIGERAHALPGVQDLIERLIARGIPIGLCSSSPLSVIEGVLRALSLDAHFRIAHSAETEAFGKPHPAAYLSCAARLGVTPHRCLAFEDSLNGAIAAKAAGMRVVAIPRGADRGSSRFDFCDARLESMSEVDAPMLQRLLDFSAAMPAGGQTAGADTRAAGKVAT